MIQVIHTVEGEGEDFVVMEAKKDDEHYIVKGIQIFNGGISPLKKMPYTFSLDGVVALITSYESELPNSREWTAWARTASRL